MSQLLTEEEFNTLFKDPPKSIFDRVLYKIGQGILGINKGIPTSFPKMDVFTTGIQKGEYILIAGETNVGKTKFARDQFVYNPYEYCQSNNIPINFIDFSLEMSMEDNMADFICKKIYNDHSIIVTRNYLFSRGQYAISPNVYKRYISKSFQNYIDEFEKHITIYDDDVTPSSYHNRLLYYAKKHGTFENPDETIISKMGKYTPDNPELYTIVLLDTLNLTEPESSQTTKQSIDRISRIGVWFRKVCDFTIVNLQQFSADLSSTDRSRFGTRTPILRDLEDSRRPGKDCSIAYGLFDPVPHDMEQILGYDVKQLAGWIRTLHLMKNRNGEKDKALGVQFKGAIGKFQELPPANKMTAGDYRFYTSN